MTTEQNTLYQFLQELMTALDGPNCTLGTMSTIGIKTLGTAMEYCKASYTNEPMTSKALAEEVASHINGYIAQIEARHKDELNHRATMERLRAY